MYDISGWIELLTPIIATNINIETFVITPIRIIASLPPIGNSKWFNTLINIASENSIIKEENPIANIFLEMLKSSLGIKEKLFFLCNFFTKVSEKTNDINWLEIY